MDPIDARTKGGGSHSQRAKQLFGKEVFQSKPFTKKCNALEGNIAEEIVMVTAMHYPLFRKLKHGLILGQLSEEMPDGYCGPALQFVYKVLAGKVCYLDLKLGGYTEEELTSMEADSAP